MNNNIDLNNVDIIYPLKIKNNENEELRYSLRSLENLPHRNVYVLSPTRLPWLSREIKWVRFDDGLGNHFRNVNEKLLLMCQDKRISDPFILMNDDIFIMKKMNELPYYALGRIKDRLDSYLIHGKYYLDTQRAYGIIRNLGKKDIDFECHAPILFYKKPLKRVLELYLASGHRRSIYCNLENVRPTYVKDFKVYCFDDDYDKNREILSTDDENFEKDSEIKRQIQHTFKRKSKYER